MPLLEFSQQTSSLVSGRYVQQRLARSKVISINIEKPHNSGSPQLISASSSFCMVAVSIAVIELVVRSLTTDDVRTTVSPT